MEILGHGRPAIPSRGACLFRAAVTRLITSYGTWRNRTSISGRCPEEGLRHQDGSPDNLAVVERLVGGVRFVQPEAASYHGRGVNGMVLHQLE